MTRIANPDEFVRLRDHAEERRTMTKKQLLEDAKWADEAYINVRSEADMAEAYYRTLETHLREAHGCTHDFAVIADADALTSEDLDPNAEWNAAGYS